MKVLKVFKLNGYELYITPWSYKRTLDWYKKEIDGNLAENMVEECDVNRDGIWIKTTAKEDIDRIGNNDEVSICKAILEDAEMQADGFGDLIKIEGNIYKYISLSEFIMLDFKGKELVKPVLLAATEWW